ncbi:MAG: alpha-2-macroglobulin [Planctomycetaceae bacterium]|jgi:uncharacterized protein YfaS (alpha-2-macroglobulin family)|nr:alpha-2-macroglobulin [Planctomycetaceae bacterium]
MRTIFTFVLFLAGLFVWQGNNFNFCGVYQNFCCANETENNNTSVNTTESVVELINAGKFKDAYDILKKLILHPQEPQNLKYITQHKIKIADTIKQAVNGLTRLKRIAEVDELLEQALLIHKNDWRVLEQIAIIYSAYLEHTGTILDNKFIRGNTRRAKYVNTRQRDYVQALIIFNQAIPLVIKDDNKKDAAQFFINMADVIRENRLSSYNAAPQILTDISQLPDYSDYNSYPYTNRGAAAVDIDGNPLFYNLPETFESAKNDMERWLWLLNQAANICPEKFRGITLLGRAEANNRLFGTTTLINCSPTIRNQIYRISNSEPENTANIWSLELLTDDETIAQTAAGIKRFKLPDEHNYLKLCREAYDVLTGQMKIQAGTELASFYSNRRQFVKAAEILSNLIDEFCNDKSVNLDECRKELDQIIGNWGQFTHEGSEVNGLNANLRYIFRNGKEVKLTAYEIDVKAHIDEIKSQREQQQKSPRVNFSHSSLSDRLHRITNLLQEDFSNKQLTPEQLRKYFLIGKPIEWTEKLTPAKNHFNTDTFIHVPIKKAGLYFIAATIENGNTVANIVWLNDTAIVKKMFNDAIVYLVVDVVTGEPIKDADVEILYGYERESQRNRYVKQFGQINTKTDEYGIAKFTGSTLPSGHLNECMVVAKGQDKRLAVMGIDYLYLGNNNANVYANFKAFILTDRPVYRPNDKVEIKSWIGNNKYDQPDTNELNGKTIDYVIYDPQGKIVEEKSGVALDLYGGFTANYVLPKNAALGIYRVMIQNTKNITSAWLEQNGFFRVEEYKKPEYEVTIDSPTEPITLGEKFKITVRAKYFFGSPVTEATVKYSVLRSTENSEWHPVRYWDWLYGNGYSWFAYNADWLPNWGKWGCYRPMFIRNRYNYSPPEQVLINETEIGADGTVTFEIDSSSAKAFLPNNSHKYSITAEVIDNSRRTIIGTSSVLVAHEPFKIYAYTNQGFYTPNQKINVNFMTKRIDGKPVTGKGDANLYKLSYKKSKQNGTESFNVVETKVYSEKVTFNNEGFAELKLNAVEAGQYKISCTLNGQEGGYVFNVYQKLNEKQNIENRNHNTNESWKFNALELIPDKAEFAPRDNVNLRINTDKENSFVYLLIRSENGIAQTIKPIKLNGKSTQIPIPVELRDMPNFFVEAITVTDGKVFNEIKEIVVPPQKRILNVEVQPDAENYKPAGKAKAKLIVTDLDGKPVVGQIVISVYDKSVEYISAGSNIGNIKEFFWKWKRYNHKNFQTNVGVYNFINMFNHNKPYMQNIGLFDHVFAVAFDESSSERINVSSGSEFGGVSDSLHKSAYAPSANKKLRSVDNDNAIAEISAFDDSISDRFIDPIIRRNFSDTAFWNGVIETDQDGVANVEFAMPESLTSWKINVWTMSQGTRVGYGSAQIITRKDLIIRMQTPRFLVEKDQVLFTANVHNYLKSDKNIQVQLETDDDLITFDKKLSSKTIKVASNGEAKIDWLVDAKKAGNAKIRMFAKTDEESDAIEKILPVYVHGILKQESWSGYIASDKNTNEITINIPQERKPEQTKLTLRYSPTLAMSLVDALPYLSDYPYGCTEQTLNRFLPTVIVQKILIDMNIDLAKLEKTHANLNAQELGTNRKPAIAREFSLQKKNPVYNIEQVREMVKEGITKLTQMQCPDGGWGWFGGNYERSSAHLTALVLHGLLLAKSNDVKIDNDNTLNRGRQWLLQYQAREVKKLQDYQLPEKEKKDKATKQYADAADAFVLTVLSEFETLHNTRNDKSAYYKSNPDVVLMRDFLWRDRGKLTPYGVSLLGIFESGSLGDVERAKDCVKILEQYLVNDDENQTAYLNLRIYNNWCWWTWDGSEFETQAYYLKLLMRLDAKSPIAPRLVKYLLNNRRHATYWNSTRDTAICIEAFAEYLKQTGESKPNLTVDILFDGEIKKTVTITPENLFEIDNTFVLSGNEITSGKHKIEFRKRNNKIDNSNNTNSNNSPLYFNAYLENFTLEDSIKSTGLEVKVSRRLYLLKRDDSARVDVIGNRGQVFGQRVEKFKRTDTERFESGDLVEVELIVESKNDYESILIGDWKCAGFEPVEVRSGYNGNELGAYVEFRDERVLFFVYRLMRGKHSVTYRFIAEQPGNFSALPTQIEAMYAPELKANSNENKIKITEIEK